MFLFQESGLVIVSSDEGVLSLEKCLPNGQIPQGGSLLISADSAELLEKAGVGSLGKIDIQCSIWWYKLLDEIFIHFVENTE